MKFDQFQTSSNKLQQVATTRNNAQHGVQTLATCWAQQCCVLLANNVASVCTGLKLYSARFEDSILPFFNLFFLLDIFSAFYYLIYFLVFCLAFRLGRSFVNRYFAIYIYIYDFNS